VEQLQALGADVLLADPHTDASQFPDGAEVVAGDRGDLERADIVAYLVDHDEFDRDAISHAGVPVLDCRRSLKGPSIHQL